MFYVEQKGFLQNKKGKTAMDSERINTILKEVIKEAQDLKIPVPKNVNEKITINPRPKKRFGCCKLKDGEFHIEISEFVLATDEKKIRGIIAHEILHACKGCQNHGARWKEYAEKMNAQYDYNIKRVSSFQEVGLEAEQEKTSADKIKYIIKCQKCGREYPRQRFTCVMKKINAYRCQCGGKLTLIRK